VSATELVAFYYCTFQTHTSMSKNNNVSEASLFLLHVFSDTAKMEIARAKIISLFLKYSAFSML